MAADRVVDVDDDTDSDVEIIETEKYNPRLDFFSDKFDPLLALRTPSVEVLDSTAKVFDNLAAYNTHVNMADRRQVPVRKQVSDYTTIERKWKEHQLPVKRTKSVKKVKNLWSRMEDAEGPLALLQKCVKEKLRIKVWTRNDRRIRGYCSAYLIAFDSYWNMALEDVTEVWSRQKKRKVPAFDSVRDDDERIRPRVEPPKISVTPHETDKKLEICRRCVPMLMIRGEQVVFVNVVDDESSRKDTKSAEN